MSVGYGVPARLADAGIGTIEPGTSLLVTGPAGVTEDLVYDLLAGGHAAGERAVVITTDTGTAGVVDALGARTADFDPGRVGIVDTTNAGDVESDVPVERPGSSGDLTGISLGTAKLVRRLGDDAVPIRLGLVSISTLLMYVDLRTVFRFLHVFTSRISGGDWLGVFALDPAMHDERTLGTLRALFDGELQVEEDEIRVLGTGFTRTE